MKKIISIVALIFFAVTDSNAQMVVQDKPNNAQLKKMVDISWNEWEPTPATNWLGIPKNLAGYVYWRILHRDYWKGEDRRPMRIGGPFDANYAALTLQNIKDQQIKDSTEKIMQTNAATYTNMLGGSFDIPYNLFFKKKFQNINEEILNALALLQNGHPSIFNQITARQSFQDFMEKFEVLNSRVDGINQSFLDKGKRITSYLDIMKEFEFVKTSFFQYLATFVTISKLPSPDEVKKSPLQFNHTETDKEIVRKILNNYIF